MEGLELATTEELVNELAKRFTSLLIVGESKQKEHDPTMSDVFELWRKNCGLTMALGLLTRAKTTIEMDCLLCREAAEEEDGEG